MPVSKKRKKGGKPVQSHGPSGEASGEARPEEHPDRPQYRVGKPKNPFVAQQPQVRGSQRGR